MNHLRARRLLAALPDGTLPPATEARVRAHAAACARCQRILSDYDAMDRLLRSIPGALLPATSSLEAEKSLGLLARCLGPARIPWFERLPVHPIGAVATAVALLVGVFLLTPPFEMESSEPFNAVVVAASMHPARSERPRRQAPNSQPVLREHSESYLLPVAVR